MFLEIFFNVSIILTVYTLVNIGQAYSATLMSRSSSSYNGKIYLHLESNHFCLMTDKKNYTNSYKCIYCSKLFTRHYEMTRHRLGCSTGTKFIYPWGKYKVSNTIFDKLASFGTKLMVHVGVPGGRSDFLTCFTVIDSEIVIILHVLRHIDTKTC